MLTLIIVGLLGGVITSISPCVLPVLPVILTAAPSGTAGTAETGERAGRAFRPFGVVAGLVISFSLSTLVGSIVLSALGLPQDLLRDLGIAVLVLIGISLIIPAVGNWIERPLSRLPRRAVNANGNGLVLGLGLGLLYVPCAGPVLAAIAVVGATHRIGWNAVILTVAFAVGAGFPLLVLAFAGDAVARRVRAVRERARGLRLGAGLIMIVVALLIGFNVTDGLQRHVPGYTTALQNRVEGNAKATKKLHDVTQPTAGIPQPLTGQDDLGGKCAVGGATPVNCGRAPQFTGIDSWFNTPGDRPLSLQGLHGKVVLIDFWTYSCINCQRALPHVEAWYSRYHAAGLDVIGVHTPEFAFEHVASNVRSQAAALGVKYPVAIDNEYATWNAYQNQYWPAEYLVDANGNLRHVTFGEGDYDGTESVIRQLLRDAHPDVTLPPATSVPAMMLNYTQTPETYLGAKYGPLHSTSGVVVHDGTSRYSFPARLDPDGFALSGMWTEQKEDLAAGADAGLEMSFRAHKAYLVLAGHGTVTVRVPGRATRTIAVDGVPKLYTLASSASAARTTLTLGFTPGVQAYDFTFG